MAVQSPPSQQPLEDSLRMGQNVNTETLSMSAPKFMQTKIIHFIVKTFSNFNYQKIFLSAY